MSNTLEKFVDKNDLLKKAEISLWLDHYDDIFSDFDPRPYSQRALSQDFIEEAKRASRDKKADVRLSFLISEKMRDQKIENGIRKRIQDHFRKHYDEFRKEKRNMILQGIIFMVIGIMFMVTATYIIFTTGENSFLFHFLVILFEPAGWFFFWEGLNLIVFDSKKLDEDILFHKKLSECEVIFVPY